MTLEVFTSIGPYELSIGVTKKPCYYSTYLSGEFSVIDLAPNVWLHSSFGRALLWEVTGSNPVEALIFSGFFFPVA